MQAFWYADGGYLYDVLGPDGQGDPTLRPNQLIALGLPRCAIDRAQAASALAAVEGALLTPYGPRTLTPDDPAYVGRYAGDVAHRDGSYHQGPVWPWLIGPYADAVLAVRGDSPETRQQLDGSHRAAAGPPRAVTAAWAASRSSLTAMRHTTRMGRWHRPGRWRSCSACTLAWLVQVLDTLTSTPAPTDTSPPLVASRRRARSAAELIVLGFKDMATADAAINEIEQMQKEALITVADWARVIRRQDGKVDIRQAHRRPRGLVLDVLEQLALTSAAR